MNFTHSIFSQLNKGAVIAALAVLLALSGPIDLSYDPDTSDITKPAANSALNYKVIFARA